MFTVTDMTDTPYTQHSGVPLGIGDTIKDCAGIVKALPGFNRIIDVEINEDGSADIAFNQNGIIRVAWVIPTETNPEG